MLFVSEYFVRAVPSSISFFVVSFAPNSNVATFPSPETFVTGGVVEATFAGKGPDLALFMGGDFPIQLAARDVLTDVSQYDDFEEVKKRFS